MYAIIQTGGKQYRVAQGDEIDVELLDFAEGQLVEFKEVLFVNDGQVRMVGSPYVAGYTVRAEQVIPNLKGPKLTVFKYKRRKNYQRKIGHRQQYTRFKITEIAKG